MFLFILRIKNFPGLWHFMVFWIWTPRTFFFFFSSSGNMFFYVCLFISSLCFPCPSECLFRVSGFLDIQDKSSFFMIFLSLDWPHFPLSTILTTLMANHVLIYRKRYFRGTREKYICIYNIKSIIILLVFLLNLSLEYSIYKFHNLWEAKR